jgi:hypothetical protein
MVKPVPNPTIRRPGAICSSVAMAGACDPTTELVINVGRPDAGQHDALDRHFVAVDEFDIRLVANLEVSTFAPRRPSFGFRLI